MSTQVKLPLYLSWRQLKNVLGWPYGRTHKRLGSHTASVQKRTNHVAPWRTAVISLLPRSLPCRKASAGHDAGHEARHRQVEERLPAAPAWRAPG